MSWRDRLADPRLPVALLALAMAASAAMILALTSQLTFFLDDWAVLLHRRGFDVDVFLDQHAGHPAIGIVVVYKAIQATFGMDSLFPYAVASTAAFLTAVALLFVWIRRFVGAWLALAAAIAILFMGSAYEDLLSPFQIGYFMPLACGIGALLALEHDDRRGDLLAVALLVVALCFQTAGLAFVAGAGIVVVLDGTLRRRFWIVVIPALLYALWYVGWGDAGAVQDSFENIATAPAFVLDGFAASASSLFGLATPTGAFIPGESDTLAWGRPLLAALLFVAGLALLRSRRVPAAFWAAATVGVIFWAMVAANATLFRTVEASRYQLLGAVFLLMCAAALARGVRPGPRVLIATFVVVAAAVASNLTILHFAFERLHVAVPVVRGDLAALKIAADQVDPDLLLTVENSDAEYFTLLDAGPFLSADEAFGSPAYTLAELESAPEVAKVGADKVLAAALPVRLRTPAAAERAVEAGGCAEAEPLTVVELPPGGALLRAAGDDARVRARRFSAESFPIELGTVRAGEEALLEIPADRAGEPWELAFEGAAPLEVCEAFGSG